MSIHAAITQLSKMLAQEINAVACFRATVTAVDGGLITVQRPGAATADTQQYVSLTRFLLAVGDEVLCVRLNGQPVVVDAIRRSVAATPTIAALTAAGSTATASVAGDDTNGSITVNPAGAGIATGSIVDLTFAVAKPSTSYSLHLTPASGAARTLGLVVGRSARATTKVTISTAVALTSGSSYVWDYSIRMYG